MLKKTLKGSESKVLGVTPETPNLVPFGDVVGCLAVRIKNCRHFSPEISLQHYNNVCIRISINNIVKCTKTCSLLPQNTLNVKNEKKTIIKFDEVKYFSVKVPRRQDDVRNNISLDLIQCYNNEKHTLLLGSVQVHLYEVIQKGCFTEEFQMLSENTFICRLEVEFMFSYGNFGYGFSHQLKPLQKIVEPPMFMNTAPPPERTDPVTNIIIPQSIEYPAFLSPDLNVTIGKPKEVSQSIQPSLVRLEKLQQQPQERLEKMKKEYRDLCTWREKAMYLEGVLNPKLEQNKLKMPQDQASDPWISQPVPWGFDELESNTDEGLEIQFEEKPEDTVISVISLLNEEAKTIPSELLYNDDKKDLTLPTLNQTDRDNSNAIVPERDESTKQSDTSLPTIPRLPITKRNKVLPLVEHPPEAVTERKLSNILFQPEVKFKDKHPSILKRDPFASESLQCSFSTLNEYVKVPNCVDGLMQDKTYGWLNTNEKGKSVAFSQKEHIVPTLRPEYIEFKPKYQNFITKDGFDPFLRNINMPVRKRNEQDISKYGNILSAEDIEEEDQDPPYPAHSETSKPTENTWPPDLDISTIKTVGSKKKVACYPAIIAMETLNTKNNLAQDPSTTTTRSVDTKKELKEGIPNVCLSNFEGGSSLTANVNMCHSSKSLRLASPAENLQQSVMLKSSLSKNLQDLSGKLSSETEAPVDTEAIKKSHVSPPPSVHDKPPSSLENKIFEKIQDLKVWLSKGDILDSKSLVNPIIKEMSAVSPSEGGPGHSPEVERDFVSETHLEVGEIAFPIKKKSDFKKKHVDSEVCSSGPGFRGGHDDVIKQIFTAPAFSELQMEAEGSSEVQMNWKNQSSAVWESLSSNILGHYEEKDNDIELPETKSVISQIIEAFPVDTLLESGIIKVMDKEYQQSSSPDIEKAFTEEKPESSTEDYSEIRSKTDSLSKHNICIIPKEATPFLNGVKFIDKGQDISPQDSKYQSTPDEKTDLSSNGWRLAREEIDLSSTLGNLSDLLMGKLNKSETIMLKSFFKDIVNAFLKCSQSEKRRKPEKELERLIQYPFPNNAENLGEIQENFEKADRSDRTPSLNPKLRVFLETLSESEIQILKSELSNHIQHYLVERLSESGFINKEDLPKLYQNLDMMNKTAEPIGKNVFLEKYSETVKETMSFVNNFNYFIDKHLEIKLRSFINEILQKFSLKKLPEGSLFKETDSESMHSNISSLRTESASISFHELGQDIPRESFGRSLEINVKYPLNKSLQNYPTPLSENELLNLKTDLSKYLQRLFIEKLLKSGLITERQLEEINNHIHLIDSSSRLLNCIKPDLPFRDENQSMVEHSEKQNKCSNIVHKATLQKVPKNRVVETELTRKEEKEYFPLQNKESSSIIGEQKRYSKEGAKTLTVIKVQEHYSNKNTQVIPPKKSLERRKDVFLKEQRKEHGFIQYPEAENFDFKVEVQDPHRWNGKSNITQSNAFFERTLKMKSLGKKEYYNISKLMAQEKPELVLPPYPRIPYCKRSNEDEEYISNTSTHFNSEAGENSQLEDQFCERLKGHNNDKKQHLLTFAHYEKEIQALYIKPSEIYNEKCDKFLESQLLKYKVVETEKNSKLSLFPKVFKGENLKPKVQKERDHVNKQKKSLNKIKIQLTTPPTSRTLKKSVPRTFLHWTARRTIHDCLDRFEDFQMTSFQHLEKAKSRARLSGRSPDDGRDWVKHTARPYTAPEANKRRESYPGKRTSPRMVSAGLAHLNDTIPGYGNMAKK